MARRYLIEGRVQGVGFRWFASQTATRLGLAGWVRNLADGRVELLADGEAGALEQLHEALCQGPQGASVTRCTAEDSAEHVDAARFSIVR